jgi:hypothetical protein
MLRKPRKYKAWLVTWEWMGDHAKRKDKIVAVLDPRLSPLRVREWVERLYLNTYGIGDQVYYALHRKKNPYPAKFTDGRSMSWPPIIHCGHNPFLMAHLVDSLTVERSEDGTETVMWSDVRSKKRHKFTT